MKSTVKFEREKQELSQSDLAKLIGVSKHTITAIEIGKYTPSITLALKLSNVFKTSVNKLFELEEND